MAPSELILPADSVPRSRRSQSISSDRPSLGGYGGLLSPPATITPDPAFIAASAASQIVTNDHDSHADTWFDQHGIEPSGETALVAPPALKLVNRFLDQLLFNFLSISRSTSLASLRPAVAEVLKPKLAKEAITGADQELHEYLGGGEEEELLAFYNGLEPNGDWDLELVWKRTRLRCMVYSSLGDMEEEDEDFHTEREQLDGPPGSNNRFSNNPGVVSPAVAIFLTSILEFMGEQILVVAGQAAYHRLRLRLEKEETDGTHTPAEIAERVVVEDSDMERVALDRTLGRLWRGWKKRVRSPTNSISMIRSFSRESMLSQPVVGTEDAFDDDNRRPSLAAVLDEYASAVATPLPMTADDVRQIEIPGLAHQSDDEEDDTTNSDEEIAPAARPKTWIPSSHELQQAIHLSAAQPQSATSGEPKSRKRSDSLPSSPPSLFRTSKRQKPSLDDETEQDMLSKNAEPKISDAAGETTTASDDYEAEPAADSAHGNSVIANIVEGAVAVGATAIAGIIAAAKGEAPQTGLVKTEREPEEFTEEAQIMTSSRISLSGRVSPENDKQSSRRSSVRSPSVHSLRLIDVASPKSPARSRHGSIDAADYVGTGRPVIVSRPSSLSSPVLSESQTTPRVASPVSRGINASPVVRNGSSVSMRQARSSAGDSISEVEEKELDEDLPVPQTAVSTDFATAMQGVDVNVPYTSQSSAPDVSQYGASKPAAFVLSPAPTPRNFQGITSAPRADLPVQAGPFMLGQRLENSYGVPPLTPLREMMEGAQDTSDEYSIAPSNDAQSITDSSINGHGPSASTSSMPIVESYAPTRVQQPHTRASPPPSTAPENVTKKPRSTHTSSSGSSSASHKLKPALTSSEESEARAVEKKGQSFEQLIRSDQTIQYTLTPQTMRDIETSPNTPRYTTSDTRPHSIRSHSSTGNKMSGLLSTSPTEKARSVKSAAGFRPVPRSQANTGSSIRTNLPQARDARVDRDSVGDFAEFIRSTGPAHSYDTVPIGFPSTNRDAVPARRNFTVPPRIDSADMAPQRTTSSASRSRLQARDAVVPRGDSISDLIDFVRSGPQLDNETHRIPRTVAPFRSTMDSDQMAGAVGGKAIDATLPDPRYSGASTSVTSSVTSQSALLNGSKAKPLPPQNRNDFDEEDMMPKRKTRRVRDPYAIDLSDEDEEEYGSSRPAPIKEESLADFLRNVPPPPEPMTSSVFDDVQRPVSSKNVKKKPSTPSIMSRFGRNGSVSTPSLPPQPQSNGTAPRSTPLYTPITAKYNTTSSPSNPSRNNNYVSQVDSARKKVVQKTYQPREAVYSSHSSTNDLADFLLRSEPPSSTQTQPRTFAPILQKEEASAFQRMFGRKKAR